MSFGLGLDLGFGLSRLGVTVDPSVAGSGTLEAMTYPFMGDEYALATGIQIDELIFDKDPATMEVPNSFLVAPQVTVSGARSNGRPIRDIDLHTEYELTLSDGTTLAYDDVVIDAINGGYTSPYKAKGNVGKIDLHKAVPYKLTVTVSVAVSSGQVRKAVYEYEFTPADHSGTRQYFDATNGNSDNDGLDGIGHLLFNGVGGGLKDATYTEATGYITKTGAFEGVTLTNEARPYSSNRWMYLNGSYVELESIIDNDTAKIVDRYKLGADATGLTSSKGAKAASDFAAVEVAHGPGSGVMTFISGMNADVYTKSNGMRIRNVLYHTGFVGYGGRATLRTTDATKSVLDLYGSASNAGMVDDCYISDIIVDGEELYNTCAIVNGSNTTESRDRVILDNCDFINSGGAVCINVQPSGQNKDTHLLISGGFLDNKWNNEHTYTINTATSGAGTITVNEAIDSAVLQHSILQIDDGAGNYSYYLSDSWAGSEITLKAGRDDDPPATLSETYSSGLTIKTFNPKTFAVFAKMSHYGIRGVTWQADGTETIYDHPIYPQLTQPLDSSEQTLHYFCHNKLLSGSRRINVFSNLNNDTYDALSRFNESFNYAEPDSCRGMLDASSKDNFITQGQFYGVMRYGNRALGCIYPNFTYNLVEVAYKHNEYATDNNTDQLAMTANEGASELVWNDYDWDWSIHANKIFNYRAYKTTNSTETGELGLKFLQKYISFRDNEVAYFGAQEVTDFGLVDSYADEGIVEFDGNNIYAPNAGATPFDVDYTSYNLADFNTLVGGTNTSTDPAWVDPANGDFSVGASNQAPIVTITTADGLTHTLGDTITLDATASDSDGTIASARWLIDGVEVETETDVNTLQYQSSSIASGAHTATIEVTDDGGLTGSDSVTFTVSGAVSPQVLTFKPSAPIYINVSQGGNAYFTQGAQYRFEHTIEFVSNGADQVIIDGASSGGYSASHAFAFVDSAGLLQLFNCPGAFIDGVAVIDGDDISAYIDDGLTHDVSIVVNGGKRIGAIGISRDGTNPFAGKIYSTDIVNNGDDAVIASFAMDEIKLDGDIETDNGITLTYNNTTGADWSTR